MTSVRNGAVESGTVHGDEWRERLRFLISLTVAGAVGLAWWSTSPQQLTGHINIVGYPSFANFAFARSFLTYRLIIWEFPIVSALVYALLRWRGPLRNVDPPSRGRIDIVDLRNTEQASGEPVHPDRGRVLRLIPPAVLVALAVSSRQVTPGAEVESVGLVAAGAYIAAVLIVSALATLFMRRRNLPTRFTPRDERLALVNGFAAAMVSVGALAQVSRYTLVISSRDVPRYWPWFPAWLAGLVLLTVFAWMLWRLANGWAPSRVERRVTVLVGSVVIFLVKAVTPDGVASFPGFDDAQSVVGADLLTRGFFPWRDFMFIHGLWEDALRSSFGFAAFEHSIWGALAGTSLILAPLCWVGYYLLSMWAGRSGSLTILVVLAAAASGAFPSVPRFIAVPLVFILLGEALRRTRPLWTVLLTIAIFVEVVLVPEASFQLIAVVITILASDLVHRDTEGAWWSALRRTRYFIATGVVLSLLLAVVLALNRSLVPFLSYFAIFGPGHNAAGAIPPTNVTSTSLAIFCTSGALVVLTTWMVARRLFARHSWTSQDWVLVSAAILTGLYGEKALGRFDGSHVLQTIAASFPLWIMWVAKALDTGDDVIVGQLRRVRMLRPAHVLLRRPLSVVALVLAVVLVPSVIETAWHLPGNTKRFVGEAVDAPLVGYEYPSTIDTRLIADLRTVLHTYAGEGPIFDNTNSLGYFHYLLQRAPASAFVHVSMAEPEFAQQVLIDQLEMSRPALVAFDENVIGLPAWDGPRNNVRHFKVAQYLLDGWTPILRTHSVLFMLRRDLVASMPRVPRLTSPPRTSGLTLSSPTCEWGYVANFLDSTPSGSSLSLPVKSLGDVSRLTVSGWASDPAPSASPSRFIITRGDSVVAQVRPLTNRPNVAHQLGDHAAAASRFDVSVTTAARGAVGVYALDAAGTVHPVGSTPAPPTGHVQMPDGTPLKVTTRTPGGIDRLSTNVSRLLSISVPASADLASFKLATFTAPATIGSARLSLTDEAMSSGRSSAVGEDAVNDHHDIAANVLPMSGSSLAVRVGSCLQWHGYKTRTLYLLQNGGAPITGLRLSGVRD